MTKMTSALSPAQAPTTGSLQPTVVSGFAKWYRRITGDMDAVVLLIAWLALYLILAGVLGGRFFSVANFQSMAVQVSSLGMLSLAMSLAMLTGGIDLSVVSIAALSSIAGAYVMSSYLVPITAENDLGITIFGIIVIIAVALACGLANGFLVGKLSVPPILATLGTMIFYSGIALAVTNGQSIGVKTTSLSPLGTTTLAGVPVVFWVLLICFGTMAAWLTFRPMGRRVYLYGESKTALKFAGVRTDRIPLSIYTLSGLFSGIAAVFMLCSQNAAREGFGESYLLQAILVAVLAGFDPDGGRGRVSNVLIAVVVLQSLQSAFSIMGYSPFTKNLVWGALLLAVMVLNYLLRGRHFDRLLAFLPSKQN